MSKPPRAKDLTGQRFGRLVVLGRNGTSKWGHSRWLCRCDCGVEKTYNRGDFVPSGSNPRPGTTSCGCYRDERLVAQNTTHGESKTPEFHTWTNMLYRCQNPRATKYEAYGGRGISVCPRWAESYQAFLDDMGRRPSDGHSIDRIDNDGNYEPGNCRWATRSEQSDNRRSTCLLTFEGRSQSMTRWAEEFGITRQTMKIRIDKHGEQVALQMGVRK